MDQARERYRPCTNSLKTNKCVFPAVQCLPVAYAQGLAISSWNLAAGRDCCKLYALFDALHACAIALDSGCFSPFYRLKTPERHPQAATVTYASPTKSVLLTTKELNALGREQILLSLTHTHGFPPAPPRLNKLLT